MSRPLLLDYCCCAGGASTGYVMAGFDVVGIDLSPQPRYPFEFVQADALEHLEGVIARGGQLEDGRRVAAVHGSPPCQAFSSMSNCRPGLAETYPQLIDAMRALLRELGLPFVLENVVGSPLLSPVMLCGAQFGLELYRHRLFETNVHVWQPEHPRHAVRASRAGHWEPGTIISVAGNCSPIAVAREAMGIDWTNRRELAEAIPPAFTEYLGESLLAAIEQESAA